MFMITFRSISIHSVDYSPCLLGDLTFCVCLPPRLLKKAPPPREKQCHEFRPICKSQVQPRESSFPFFFLLFFVFPSFLSSFFTSFISFLPCHPLLFTFLPSFLLVFLLHFAYFRTPLVQVLFSPSATFPLSFFLQKHNFTSCC